MTSFKSKFATQSSLAKLAIAGIAAGSLAFAAPAYAKDRNVNINIGGEGDLLEQLIELDADGIEELRAEIADARDEIADAIADIEEAREDVKDAPGARMILKVAFASARVVTSTAVDEALREVRTEIDRAERDLKTADVSDEEKVETQGAIDMLRAELDALELSLEDLVDALRA
ncbi:MAG TPA: hypothetical protein PKM48_08415 [Parvularculaceae bacterium]|nr:hypothetical protein [Parvularculaceae bacterium]HNS86441.1 hypothetical protein [Parvularculaceae bacterium]